MMPALQTDSGRLVSIAQLIAFGYASLYKDCGRMRSSFQWEPYLRVGNSSYPSESFFYRWIARWLTAVGYTRRKPKFDSNLGGFVAAIGTSYQTDFKRKCISSDDAQGDRCDDDGDGDGYYASADDEDNYEIEELGHGSHGREGSQEHSHDCSKPTTQSWSAESGMSNFISLFHTCGSGRMVPLDLDTKDCYTSQLCANQSCVNHSPIC